ncbi:hypothetical protein Pst134EA_032815 [Puccinia striiformis f. sp. tritici]|uniref:uncharacterized protein n=1 Tax=Puccinia striiformis f. sp. tritici TaxID=168172 RepID=UPI0020087668|nr:uncharacterized protein Pst134EA_032815 [Puccinia striiformis f. sp. tritici]KAH9441587.1 hypothetical protein Pst134EA_032815 [Puccinia striiformis f. sp. tritici]
MSLLFPNLASLANPLTPSTGADRSSIFFTYLPGIVDDAQSKAKQLKSKSKEGLEGAKATISSEADALKNKVATAAGVGATPKASSTRPSTIECSLWAGLGTRIVMIGTLTALQWLIYDYVKVAFGLPTTGSAEPQKK